MTCITCCFLQNGVRLNAAEQARPYFPGQMATVPEASSSKEVKTASSSKAVWLLSCILFLAIIANHCLWQQWRIHSFQNWFSFFVLYLSPGRQQTETGSFNFKLWWNFPHQSVLATVVISRGRGKEERAKQLWLYLAVPGPVRLDTQGTISGSHGVYEGSGRKRSLYKAPPALGPFRSVLWSCIPPLVQGFTPG